MAGKPRQDIAQTKPLAVRVRRAALLLDVCERTVRRLADKEVLDDFYVGSARMITMASIEKLARGEAAA
jgi:hypothetical protein